MTNFEGSWGASNSHEPPVHLSERSQMELAKLQVRPQSKLSGWLADAVENVPSGARVDTWLPQRSALIETSARFWIDSLFTSLRRIVKEFDSSSASEDLQIVIDGPRVTMELPCRRDPSFSPYKFKCYEGHLASYNWALLVRSYYECMQIFIIPSQMLLGLETNLLSTNELRVLLEFRPAVNETSVQWALADLTVSAETIPAIARELFSDFIKLALGIITESELYTTAGNDKQNNDKQPDDNQPDDSRGQSTIEQEQLFEGTVKDLQLWQTRNLFSRGLSRDIDALLQMQKQPGSSDSLKLQVESLYLQYAELKMCWETFVSKMESLTARTVPEDSLKTNVLAKG